MNQETEIEILNELRRITKLLALTVANDKTQKEQIALLSGVDFQPKEIANMIGTTSNTVRVTLARLKKDLGNKAKTEGNESNDKSQAEADTAK